jgi:hypothetical protein
MEIGGKDTTLLWEHNGAHGKILEGMARIWKDGVYHLSGEGTHRLDDRSKYPVGKPSEIFVYENLSTLKSWDDFGRTDQNDNSMAYFIFSDDSVTFVTGETAPVVDEIVMLLTELSNPECRAKAG